MHRGGRRTGHAWHVASARRDHGRCWPTGFQGIIRWDDGQSLVPYGLMGSATHVPTAPWQVTAARETPIAVLPSISSPGRSPPTPPRTKGKRENIGKSGKRGNPQRCAEGEGAPGGGGENHRRGKRCARLQWHISRSALSPTMASCGAQDVLMQARCVLFPPQELPDAVARVPGANGALYGGDQGSRWLQTRRQVHARSSLDAILGPQSQRAAAISQIASESIWARGHQPVRAQRQIASRRIAAAAWAGPYRTALGTSPGAAALLVSVLSES